METLSSAKNRKVLSWRSLRDKKGRLEQNAFLVEGVRMVREALSSSFTVNAVLLREGFVPDFVIPDSIRTYLLPEHVFQSVCDTKTPQGIAAVLNLQAKEAAGSRLLALDGVQDPGNVGTIIRTADWFGVRHHVCSEGTVSCFNPKVVQATMGGLFRTQVVYTHLPDYLQGCGMPIYGAVLDGDSIWSSATHLCLNREGAVLVIGNESRGISPEVQQCLTHRVTIPNPGGTAESLNAAVACAILLAELLRIEN